MAKSARSSTRKENNRRKFASVFSPAEAARNERLSAKLLQLARQPKPESSDVKMDEDAAEDDDASSVNKQSADTTAMEIDPKPSKLRIEKKRINKRKQKKSSIVFQKYSDRSGRKKKSSK
ncbi:uncharacterized protein UV8b_06305 [Ustilaginoidea virens]|uniref:DUF2423 domain-containing protein n=1 Tax=Ustilaginoidea virens TaxID=1159556 RepID=A0A8E5HVM9_USTVR|nr:uncharacterized protein UV8b_06305 [Ustilaginoidea virens]QUC22064.1 hypothetical protein UV8b_06305 [Ustilaginoidea virens]